MGGVEGVVLGANHRGNSAAIITFWQSQRHISDAARISDEAREQAMAAAQTSLTPLVDQFEITIASGLGRLSTAVGASVRASA